MNRQKKIIMIIILAIQILLVMAALFFSGISLVIHHNNAPVKSCVELISKANMELHGILNSSLIEKDTIIINRLIQKSEYIIQTMKTCDKIQINPKLVELIIRQNELVHNSDSLEFEKLPWKLCPKESNCSICERQRKKIIFNKIDYEQILRVNEQINYLINKEVK
jgi:hypothetical protein